MTGANSNELTQRINELEELNLLARVLGAAQSVEETLAAIIRCSQSLCKAERGAIVLFEPSSGKDARTIARHSEPSTDSIDHTINLLTAAHLLKVRKPFVTDNILETVQLVDPSEPLLHLGPSMVVPLTHDGNIIGMIHHVNSKGGAQFNAESLRVAEIIANMASQFIVRAKLHESLQENVRQLRISLEVERGARPILGTSKAMRKVLETVSVVAPTNANVLIFGETGTGKELVARSIHVQSPRAAKPFIAINCAAIPTDLFESELFGHERGAFTGATGMLKGKFELANGGTIFLDELSEMPSAMQPKLLRVLEEQKFSRVGSAAQIQIDVRVISASSKDLEEAIREGSFRESLFHRLNVVPIALPPLRERPEDIPVLAAAMLEEFSHGIKHFDASAVELLCARVWKGNVRELRNTIERISILVPHRMITAEHLQQLGIDNVAGPSSQLAPLLKELLGSSPRHENLPDRLEQELIKVALDQSSGNVSQAARLLGIDRMTLQRRIEKHGLQPK